MSGIRNVAQAFKSLHQRAHKPLVLVNVYDILSARAVAELPTSEALATTSYGVAQAAGLSDDDLTLEANLTAVRGIASIAQRFKKPLTVDLQDGYGSKLESAIESLIGYGVAGINLEDYDRTTGDFFDIETASDRIRRTMDVARKLNVPDFVVNARCDVLVHGGVIEEVLKRGVQYLAAGATTVFVWGRARGVSKEEVEQLVKAFDGRLNVILKLNGGLSVKQLADIGVARISIGPTLQMKALQAIQNEAKILLGEL